MKIGIVTHNYPAGKFDRQNAGIFVYDLAYALKKLGHDVFVLCPEVGGKVGKNNIPVTWFPWPGSGRKMGSLNSLNPLDLLFFFCMVFSGIIATDKFVKDNDIEFMVGMWSFPAGIFTFWAKLRQKIPYCLWSLGSDIHIYAHYPLINLLMKLTLGKANFLLADGVELAKETADFVKRPCQYIPSATNFPTFNKTIKKKEGPIKFIFLGRMEPVKGPDILITAVLSCADLNFELHCLGEGSLLSILKNQVKRAGLNKKIIFHGNPSDQKIIYSMFSSSDWLIIPSRNDTISLAFSEGMKAGIPVIAAEVGDIPEFMKKYRVGLSFPVENNAELANLMRKAINGGRALIKQYQKETKRAADFFDIDSSAKKLSYMINKDVKLQKDLI